MYIVLRQCHAFFRNFIIGPVLIILAHKHKKKQLIIDFKKCFVTFLTKLWNFKCFVYLRVNASHHYYLTLTTRIFRNSIIGPVLINIGPKHQKTTYLGLIYGLGQKNYISGQFMEYKTFLVSTYQYYTYLKLVLPQVAVDVVIVNAVSSGP